MSWVSLLRTHELLGDNRLKFSHQLSDMSEELVTITREADKTRKANKELGNRLEKGLSEQESLVEKVGPYWSYNVTSTEGDLAGTKSL